MFRPDRPLGVAPLHKRAAPRPRLAALLVLASAQFVLVLDASIVNVALPSIQRALGFARVDVQWVETAYMLAFGGFMLLGSRVADIWGRRRVFLWAMAVFALTSLMAGLSISAPMLVAARAVEGVVGAILAPTALALLVTACPPGAERNRALGLNGIAIAGGFVVGAILGALLTTVFSWRAIFFTNVPVCLFAAVSGSVVLSRDGDEVDRPTSLDVIGAATLTAALLLLLYGVAIGNRVDFSSPRMWGPVSVASLLFVSFGYLEARTMSPLLPIKILPRRAVLCGAAAALLASATDGGVLLVLTLYLQQVLGYGPLGAAAVLSGFGCMQVLAGVSSPTVVRVCGARATLFVGLILEGGGALILADTPRHDALPVILLGTSLLAYGYITALVTATILATASPRNDTQGVVGGVMNAAVAIGAALGLSVLGTLASTPGIARLQGMRHAMLAGAALVGLGLTAAAFSHSSAGSRSSAPYQAPE